MVSLAKSKKAIFFTFVAILLLSTLVLSFSIYSRYRLRTKALVMETRINAMNSFIKDLDKDIDRGCFIASYRAMLSMVEHVSSSGAFIDNVSIRFEELFLNGTLYSDQQDLMVDSTFNDWEDKMKEQGDKINLNLNFTFNSLEINHTDPWNIGVYLGVSLYASDVTGIASWNMSKSIETTVPIEGFEDPTYAANTLGKVLNKINKTPFTDFVIANDTTNLLIHAENSYYVEWTTAPSFLMRLEGNLNASPYGIESLINLDELKQEKIGTEKRSVVDHIYWSNKSVLSYKIKDMPAWFRMDDEYNSEAGMTHLELYEVEDLTQGPGS